MVLNVKSSSSEQSSSSSESSSSSSEESSSSEDEKTKKVNAKKVNKRDAKQNEKDSKKTAVLVNEKNMIAKITGHFNQPFVKSTKDQAEVIPAQPTQIKVTQPR